MQPADRIYVWHISQVPFEYYRSRIAWHDLDAIIGRDIPPTAAAYEAEFQPLRGTRAWIVLSHWAALDGPDERSVILPVLNRMGTRLDAFEAKGAMVVLYDLGKPMTATSGPAPANDSPPR
jgi:hypothetical protein